MRDKPLGSTLGWKTLKSSRLFESKWFSLRQDLISVGAKDPDSFTFIEHPGSVFVVPVTTGGKVLLLRSYRYTVDAWCWEVPAGTMADCGKETAEAMAIRELREEAGATCRALTSLGKFFLGNGYARHHAEFFLAHDVEIASQPKPEPLENISSLTAFSVAEIRSLLLEGEISDGDSVLALLLFVNQADKGPSVC